MPGMGGGSTPGGSSAGLFLPPNQGAAAQGFQDILAPMTAQSIGNLTALQQPPAQTAYPFVQNAAFSTINNPFQGQAIDSAQNANWFLNQYMTPNATSGAAQLEGMAGLAPGYAQQSLNIGANPAYGRAGEMGQGFASQLAGMGSDLWGQSNQIAPQLTGMASQLTGMGQQISNQAFDPQSMLFNRTQNQLLDQSNATNSMYGLGSSPYGASTTANAMGNFDLNWQNNLLDRMTMGGRAASGLDTAAGNLDQAALQSLISGGQAASGLDEAALSGLLRPANAQAAAAVQGTAGFGNLMSSAERGFAGAGNLLNPVGSAISSFGTQPYNTANTIQGNNMGALQNLISLGNQQYTVPQQTIQDLNQYMGLGQSASSLANSIGATNFNEGSQMFQGAGQLLGGANSLFGGGGGGGMFGGGGGGGLLSAGGLLGSQGPLFGTAADASIAAGGPPLAAEMAPLAFSA